MGLNLKQLGLGTYPEAGQRGTRKGSEQMENVAGELSSPARDEKT